MDRMIHTALNSLKMIMENQQITSQNLANASVAGYRRDMVSDFSSVYLESQKGLDPRVFSTRQIGGFSSEGGDLANTENPLDIAIKGEGYFIIEPQNGEVGLARRGDLLIDPEGLLRSGDGNIILSNDLQPITLPAFKEIQISGDGEILIQPLNAPEGGPLQAVAQIGTTRAEDLELIKYPDGIIRPEGDVEITADQQSEVIQYFLEESNVNTVQELVLTLEQQRHYEAHVKFIELGKQFDEGGATLMRMPE